MSDKIETVIGEIELGVHRDYGVRYPWEVAAYAADLAEQFQEKGTLPDHTKPLELDENDRKLLAATSWTDVAEIAERIEPGCAGIEWIEEIQDRAEDVLNALLPEGYYAGGDSDAGGWGFWKTEEED